MAFKRADASSADWPLIKNACRERGGNSSQEASDRDVSRFVYPACLGLVDPESTMLGFRSIPSSITRCT